MSDEKNEEDVPFDVTEENTAAVQDKAEGEKKSAKKKSKKKNKPTVLYGLPSPPPPPELITGDSSPATNPLVFSVIPLTPDDVLTYMIDHEIENPVRKLKGSALSFKVRSLIKQTLAAKMNRTTTREDLVPVAEMIFPTVQRLAKHYQEQLERAALATVAPVSPTLGPEFKEQETGFDSRVPINTDLPPPSSLEVPQEPDVSVQALPPPVGVSMIDRLVKEVKYNVKLSVPQLEALVHNTEFSWPLMPARFDMGDMVAMEKSVLLAGRIIAPIVVLQGQPASDSTARGPELLVDGLRRVVAVLRLVKQEKLDPGTVTSAIVLMPDMEAVHAMGRARVGFILRILLNFNLKQFNPVEEAAAVVRSLLNTGLGVKDVTRLIGSSSEKVTKRVALFGAAPEVAEAIKSQVISAENAYELIQAHGSKEEQAKALKRILSGAPSRDVGEDGNKRQVRRVQLKDITGDLPISAKRSRNLLAKISTAYTRWARSGSLPGDNGDDTWEELEALLRTARNLKIAGKLVF